MTQDVQRRREQLWEERSMTGARLKEIISKKEHGKNDRALQLPAEFLRIMDAPVHKPVVLCFKKEKCPLPECTFHHFSPAANHQYNGDPSLLRKALCKYGASCTRALCHFNHPSPCTWGDPPSRTSSADAMVESGPNRQQQMPRGNVGSIAQYSTAMDMAESENTLHSSRIRTHVASRDQELESLNERNSIL